jgi:hypothetical protein
MNNVPIFEWTSRYGYFLDNEIAPLFQDEPFCFFARSFIQYQSLKELLLTIEPLDHILRNESINTSSNMGDDCCICLEPLERNLDLVITKCMHCFHSSCFRKLFDQAEHRPYTRVSCPLCRSPNICLDARRDRAIVDLARAIESNLRVMERCHQSVMRHTQLRMRMLAHEAGALPYFSRILCCPRLRAVRHEAAALRDLLRATALFATASREGFRTLLQELDARRAGAGPAAADAARVAARCLAADATPLAPIEAAIAAIATLGLQLKLPATLPVLPARPEQPSDPAHPASPAPASGAPRGRRWAGRARGARGWRAGSAAAVLCPPNAPLL